MDIEEIKKNHVLNLRDDEKTRLSLGMHVYSGATAIVPTFEGATAWYTSLCLSYLRDTDIKDKYFPYKAMKHILYIEELHDSIEVESIHSDHITLTINMV